MPFPPWRCPACNSTIQHAPAEVVPRNNVIYRCHVCRLELVCAVGSEAFTVAPLPSERTESAAK